MINLNKIILISAISIIWAGILLILFLYNPIEIYQKQKAEKEAIIQQKHRQEQLQEKQRKIDSDIIDIKVNEPTDLNYKTKNEIYDLRKKYVSESIFASPYYNPSNYVFGQIVDNKPWISLNFCEDSQGRCRIGGRSEESRFINNPMLLVSIENSYFPFSYEQNYSHFCKAYVEPKKIQYNKRTNEIITTYKSFPYYSRGKRYFSLIGLNAKDFGYNYGYVDMEKSTLKLKFIEKEYNISNAVIEFQDYFHLGGACRHEGGCNNASPYQGYLVFMYDGETGGKRVLHPELYIKLWRNRPNSPNDKPDIVQRIVLRKNYSDYY